MEIRQKAFDTIFFSYICKVLSVSWIETIIFSLQKKHRWRIMPEASPICIKSIKKGSLELPWLPWTKPATK